MHACCIFACAEAGCGSHHGKLPFCSQGRYSFVGAQPALEVVARGRSVTVIDHATRQRTTSEEADPMQACLGFFLCHLLPCATITLGFQQLRMRQLMHAASHAASSSSVSGMFVGHRVGKQKSCLLAYGEILGNRDRHFLAPGGGAALGGLAARAGGGPPSGVHRRLGGLLRL